MNMYAALFLIMSGLSSSWAFFPPDEATKESMNALKPREKGKFLLRDGINHINDWALKNRISGWTVESTVVDRLPGGRPAQIVPETGGTGDGKFLRINLQITEEGLKNPAVVMEELIRLDQITHVPVLWAPKEALKAATSLKSFMNPFQWAEMVMNARAGSLEAMEKLTRAEVEATNVAVDAVKYYEAMHLFRGDQSASEQRLYLELPESERMVLEKPAHDYVRNRAAHAKALYEEVAQRAKASREIKLAAWKNKEKEILADAGYEKLQELVSKGDRAGVRKFVDPRLPWDLMEPSEIRSWQKWLEAIETPSRGNMRIAFIQERGLKEAYVIQNAAGPPYWMSSVFTEGTGIDFSAMRDLKARHAVYDPLDVPEGGKYVLGNSRDPDTLSVMMSNTTYHGDRSPFIHVSDYDSANNALFGRRMAAVSIDGRRMIPNAFSNLFVDTKMAVPLVIFPDEVVYYHDYDKNSVSGMSGPESSALGSASAQREHFIREVEKRSWTVKHFPWEARVAARTDSYSKP